MFRYASSEICNYKVHSISEERIILLSGTGFLEANDFNPEDFSRILWTNSPKSKIIPFLKLGIYVEIQTARSLHKGKIIGLKLTEILLEEQNTVKEIAESEIKSLTYKPNSFQLFANTGQWLGKTTHLVPGYLQFHEGNKIKGSVFMGLSFLSILGAASEYNKASSLSKVNYNFYTINNRIFIEQDSKSRNQSIRSQKNGNALIGLFFVIFLYHLWDINFNTYSDSIPQEANFLDRNHLPHSLIPQWEFMDDRQNEIFRFKFSF